MALHKDVEEAFSKNECLIRRFRGQTVIYIPTGIAEKVDKETLTRFAVEVFTQQRLDEFDYREPFRSSSGHYEFEVPNVPLESKYPDHQLPNRLVELILDYIK